VKGLDRSIILIDHEDHYLWYKGLAWCPCSNEDFDPNTDAPGSWKGLPKMLDSLEGLVQYHYGYEDPVFLIPDSSRNNYIDAIVLRRTQHSAFFLASTW
jgi:hypothetical protein